MLVNHKLTIVIPSYNRIDNLINTLSNLLIQSSGKVQVIVLDNCSTANYEQLLLEQKQLNRFIAQRDLIIIRNKFNLGMSANFMRCFEVCTTDWVWIISDDDLISDDAIATVLQAINSEGDKEDTVMLKFFPYAVQDQGLLDAIQNLPQLATALAHSAAIFNKFIFISNGVYRISKLRPYIAVGYNNCHTYVPHLMMVINAVAGGDKIQCINKEIVRFIQPEVGYSYGLVAGLGVGAFKNMLFDLDARHYAKLDAAFAIHNDYKVIIDIYYFAKTKANNLTARRLVYNYRKQIARARTIWQRAGVLMFGSLLRFPPLFELVVKILGYNKAIAQHISEIITRNAT